ncbi:MAG: DUF2203 domain-containing protein [Ignavibacteriales bacterium]|nr:DUF2203 domain-containing protein [Ignavibacteriales bacterium]
MPQTEVKYFSPNEAQKTLPLVKQIVRDILNNAYQIKTIADSLNGKIDDNSEIQQLIGQIDSYIRELNEIGCTFKDWNFQIGLVDFPSVIDGEDVLLCWRSDEDAVRFYHSLDDGFAGRKPIPEEYY